MSYNEAFDSGYNSAISDMYDVMQNCGTVVLNAKLIKDPAMNNTTNIYSVPVDDIVALREAILKFYLRNK